MRETARVKKLIWTVPDVLKRLLLVLLLLLLGLRAADDAAIPLFCEYICFALKC